MFVITPELVEKVKLARRIKTNAFDSQIMGLLMSWQIDMKIAGVEIPEEATPILETAAITYVAMNFGDPDDYERLKRSYDEQKGQLATFTGYTDWGDSNGSV